MSSWKLLLAGAAFGLVTTLGAPAGATGVATEFAGAVAAASAPATQQVAGECGHHGLPGLAGGLLFTVTGAAETASATVAQSAWVEITCTLVSPAQGLPGEMPTRLVSATARCLEQVCVVAPFGPIVSWPVRPVVVCVEGSATFGSSFVVVKQIPRTCA